MNIFIHAHYYLPKTLAGAEKYLHAIAKHLDDFGHKVVVSIDEDVEYNYEGIKVVSNQSNIFQRYVWADAIITHLLNAETAINLGRQFNKPVFHLLHNNKPALALLNAPEKNYLIYNTEALKKELNINLPSIVAHPYVDVDYFDNDNDHFYNEYITLVNVCREKGGLFLQDLANYLPQYRFMGVKGSYNDQLIQNSQHRNIQFMAVQTDMRKVYDQTRIIIMPSNYESWGMVASEAMASGIPVVCADTAGLQENCGSAAIYCEQYVRQYMNAFIMLDNKNFYDKYVALGKKRNKKNDLDKILKFMEKYITTVSNMAGVFPEPKPAPEPKIYDPEEDDDDDEDLKEKEEINTEEDDDEKEKKVIKPVKEKKQIAKPGRKTVKRSRNGQFSS